MKLCRFGQPGQEKPGLVSEDGTIRDLSGVVDDITVETLARARAADPATLPVVEGTPRYGVPVNGIGKIVAIGLNYEDHAIESNLPIPTEPMMFMKAVSSLNGPNDPVMLPQDASHGDWEVELGVIIGRTCRYVSEDEALDRVAGYVLANDVSERFNQKQRGTQWSKGKGHDTFCPVGPWLVTPDEVGDPHSLGIRCVLNGETLQNSSTGQLIFNIPQTIAYLSHVLTLEVGDVIFTGTPPGVGFARKPPVFLKGGDEVEIQIDVLGSLRNPVVAG